MHLAVAFERRWLGQVRPYLSSASGFVDVVAEMDDEVEVILHHGLIGREVSLAEVLARSYGQAQGSFGEPRTGNVRVLPVGLSSPPAKKR